MNMVILLGLLVMVNLALSASPLYYIINVNTNRFLDGNTDAAVQYDSLHPRPFTWPTNMAESNHTWYFEDADQAPYVLIKNANTHKCLDGNRNVLQYNDDYVSPFLWSTCLTTATAQHWERRSDDFAYYIVNRVRHPDTDTGAEQALDGNVDVPHKDSAHPAPFLWNLDTSALNHKWFIAGIEELQFSALTHLTVGTTGSSVQHFLYTPPTHFAPAITNFIIGQLWFIVGQSLSNAVVASVVSYDSDPPRQVLDSDNSDVYPNPPNNGNYQRWSITSTSMQNVQTSRYFAGSASNLWMSPTPTNLVYPSLNPPPIGTAYVIRSWLDDSAITAVGNNQLTMDEYRNFNAQKWVLVKLSPLDTGFSFIFNMFRVGVLDADNNDNTLVNDLAWGPSNDGQLWEFILVRKTYYSSYDLYFIRNHNTGKWLYKGGSEIHTASSTPGDNAKWYFEPVNSF